MQKLIIVCGLPGTGITELANELSKELSISVLHKDCIKEALYEIQNLSTLEESRIIGLHSMLLLHRLTEKQLDNGFDIIIEAPFNVLEGYKLFRKWERKYNNLHIFSIICEIDEKERRRRCTNRERHAAHHDNERGFEGRTKSKAYKKLPGKIIKVRTDRPVTKLVSEISTSYFK